MTLDTANKLFSEIKKHKIKRETLTMCNAEAVKNCKKHKHKNKNVNV